MKRVPVVTRWAAILVLATVLLVSACGGSMPTTDPLGPSGPRGGASSAPASAQASSDRPSMPVRQDPADPAAVAQAKALIEGGRPADPGSLQAVGARVLFTRSGGEAARSILESSTDRDALWTALWVFGTSGVETAPLLPILRHEDSSIRTIAAAGAVGMGASEGFDVLKEALASESEVLGSEPPITLQGFALNVLEGFVDAPPESAPEWSSWLSANSANLLFDPITRIWRVP
jgi:hypothetical protein